MKQIYLIHLTIIFLLLLVIYGSAQQTQEEQEQPSQTFFYGTHTITFAHDMVKIDGENGTVVDTGDLSFPPSEIVDVAEANGSKGVLLSHSLNGAVGKTEFITTVLSQSTLPVGVSGEFEGINITYVATVNGTHGTYDIYYIGDKLISPNEPTLMKINGHSFLFTIKQNTLEIFEVKAIDETVGDALMVELILGILVGGLIAWTYQSGRTLLS